MVSTGSDMIRIVSANNSGGISLNVYPNRDTLAKPLVVAPTTFSPEEPPFLRAQLSDFAVVVAGAMPPADVLRVGGFPARRVLLGFDIPPRIIDSTVVVRATLLLTQRPSVTADAGEAVAVQIVPVLVSDEVTDLHTRLEFAAAGAVDSLTTVPKDSGVVKLEMVNLLRAWRGQPTDRTPRVAALFLSSEATRVAGFEFFSMEAAASLRPRLRITYVIRVNSGQP
jgi:hypothetical protein